MPKITVQGEGTTVSEKRTINFVAGDNITITVTDDGDSVNIQINGEAGGEGSGHTIQDDDTAKTARTNLSFQDGFVVADDAGGDQTEVDLSYAATPSTQAFGDSAAAGTAITATRGDHKHAMPANPVTSHESTYAHGDIAGHIGDSSAAHAASAVSADSTTLVGTGTDVQAVLEELDNGIADHLADTADAHDASAISILDTADDFTATDVEGALAELQADAETHAGAADPHAGYRLESADHTHASTGAQAGQLDHGTALTGLTDDDHTQYRLESADHTHQTTGAQAGQLDHGLALTGLTDDDHTQYRLESADIQSESFSKEGTIATGTGTTRWYNDTGRTLTLQSVRASVGTAPTGASLIVDLNINGTSVWASTQANRPTIAIDGFTDEGGAFDDATVADGEYITADVDQVGSTVAGADLTVTWWWIS